MVLPLPLPSTGMGNSPPTRKLAVSPLMRGQVRLGQHVREVVLRQRVDDAVEVTGLAEWNEVAVAVPRITESTFAFNVSAGSPPIAPIERQAPTN